MVRTIIPQKVVLGTAQFSGTYGIANSSGQLSRRELFKLLTLAWEIGIRQYDTAPGYGSENLLGEFSLAHGVSGEIVVLNKLPSITKYENYREKVTCHLEQSLRSLNGNISILFFHNPEDSLLLLENPEYFQGLIDTYQIPELGVSVYEPKEISRLSSCKLPLAFQFPINLVDKRFEDVYMPLGKRYARSIFLQGVLTATNGLKNSAPTALVEFHHQYFSYLRKNNIDPLRFALSFSFFSDVSDYLILGVDNVQHLQSIFDVPLYDTDILRSYLSGIPIPTSDIFDPRTWADGS